MNSSVFMPVLGVHSGRTGGEWLRPLSGNWPSALCAELEIAPAVVRVVVAAVRGSSPREPGTCMLVSSQGTIGTIGGGHLEWQAIQFALELLDCNDGTAARTKRLVLGVQLGQCCGGVVELWIERYTRRDVPLLRSADQAARSSEPALMATVLGSGGVTRRVMQAATPAFLPPHLRSSAEALLEPDAAERVRYVGQHVGPSVGQPVGQSAGQSAGKYVGQSAGQYAGQSVGNTVLLERLNPANADLWLYGAGHVARALVRVLAELPVRITWIDSRTGFLPPRVAPNIRTLQSPAPAQEALAAPPSARHLVMTHDHALDYEICRSLLRRDEIAWLGLIGSASKGARFRSRLQREGLSQVSIDRLVCPIGVEGVDGKAPSIIAISVAAQLLQTLKDPAELALPRQMPLATRARASGATAVGADALEAKPFEAKPFEAKPFEAKPFEAKPFEAKAFEAKAFEATPRPPYARERAFDDCAAENCDSCGTRRRASV